MEDEREVERLGLERRVAPVLADEREEVLRRAVRGVGVAHHERAPEVVVGLGLVGVGGDRGETRDQFHGLAEVRLDVEKVGRGVVCVGGKDGARDGVHDVLAWRTHDRVLLEALGQAAVLRENRLPLLEALARGELAEKEQVCGLLEAEAALLLAVAHEVLHVDAAVV